MARPSDSAAGPRGDASGLQVGCAVVCSHIRPQIVVLGHLVELFVAVLGPARELAAVRRSLVGGRCELALEPVHLVGELPDLQATAAERGLAAELLENMRGAGDHAMVVLKEVAHDVEDLALVLVGPFIVPPTEPAGGLVAGASGG